MTIRTWNPSSSKVAMIVPKTPQVVHDQDACSDTPVDPFLLDFGTSVNVNEDLRRVIRGEIQEIDESINGIVGETKKEETVGKQLRQDLEHSHAEMTSLSRCVQDQLENVHVHTTFLQGLATTLQTDLVVSTGIKNARNPSVVSLQLEDKHDSASSDESGTRNSTTYKGVIHHCNKRLKRLTTSMKETSREMDDIIAKHRATIASTKAIQRRIEVDALETVLTEKIQEGDCLMQELQQTKEKLHAIRLATHKNRTESGSNAQQLADLTKELDAVRRDGEVLKNELLKKVTASQEVVINSQIKVEEQRSQIDKVMVQLEELAKQKELLKVHAESKQALEAQQQRNDDLLRRKAELAAKLQESSLELNTSSEELHVAQQLHANSLRLKAENDENHNIILVPGRVELCEIAEKKEKLAALIREAQKHNSDLQIIDTEALTSKLETKRNVLQELAALEEEARSVKAKREALSKSNKESEETWRLEIEEHISLEKNLRAAVDAKTSHLEETRETQSTRRRRTIDEANQLAENVKEEGERLVAILNAGMDLFKKTEERLGRLGETLDM